MSSEKSYLLYLDSGDKISGKNNDANFNINWASFLPQEYNQYEMSFMFQTASGTYTDSGSKNIFSSCEITADFTKNSKSFETSSNSSSNVIGYARRSIQTGYAEYACIFDYNPKKVISLPNQNLVNFKIYNVTSKQPLYNNQGTSTLALTSLTNVSGSQNVTLTAGNSNASLQVGQSISGTGIQSGSTIISISGLNMQLSKPTTSGITSANVTVDNSVFTVTVTGTNTLGQSTFTLGTANPYLQAGQSVYGVGVQADTKILSVAGDKASVVLTKVSSGSGITSLTAFFDNSVYSTSTLPFIGITNTSGTTTLTLTSANSNLLVGLTIIGTGIPAGTVITNINGTAITISKPTSSAVTSANVLFEILPIDMTSWNMIMKFTPVV